MIKSLKTWIEDVWWSWGNAIHFRLDRYEDNIDRCAFFYELSSGWYSMYDPDDMGVRDPHYVHMMSNPEKIYVTKEDYDAIMEKIKEPPKYIEGLANLMKRKLP